MKGAAWVMVLIVCIVTVALLVGREAPADYDAGNIIADEVFYDSDSMTEVEIADFISEVNRGCRGVCLRDYVTDVPGWDSNEQCDEIPASEASSASRIIYQVAQSCKINPQVLLVMLQKEQGLVTGTKASPERFSIAMGYGCPDTAECDSEFFGFGNQVYRAAWQMRRYAALPERYDVKAGEVNNIAYHPDPKCGSGEVLVENAATAALYNYTPYQPNSAALAGRPDECSSFGNLNFSTHFKVWFQK